MISKVICTCLGEGSRSTTMAKGVVGNPAGESPLKGAFSSIPLDAACNYDTGEKAILARFQVNYEMADTMIWLTEENCRVLIA